MTATHPPHDIPRSAVRKAYAASLTGTSLEWYDFAVYSSASALVLPQLFFPSSDPLTGTLLAFSTYAVGYVARPLGGVLFGRLGDVIGRKKVLVATLLIIGIATFVIGLLPTYATIGVAAPVLLVLMRFAQGVGVGGEWGGAVLLSAEFGDPRRRGFYSSAAQIGPPAGNLLANGVLALLTATMSEATFEGGGWRIAFLLSALLVAFGLWIRLKLEDTPVFQAIAEKGEAPATPVREVFRTAPRQLVAAICSRIGPDVLYGMFTVFVLVYGTTQIGYTRGQVLAAVLTGSACQLVLMPLAGAVSDRFDRRKVYGAAAVCGIVWPFVFFGMISGGSEALLILGVVVGLAIHAFMYGPQAAFVTEQFSPRLRYTGSSLAYTIAGLFGGAIAPLVFTALLDAFDSGTPIAVYIAVACVVTLVGLSLGRGARAAEAEDREALTRTAAPSA